MSELSMERLLNRVFTTTERVKFSQADPYGHLGTAEYVNLFLNHRVEALTRHAGVDLTRLARTGGITFPTRTFEVELFAPCFVGDPLEIASWIAGLRSKGMTVHGLIRGAEDRQTRAACTFHFVSADARTGRPVALPAALESSLEMDGLEALPKAERFLQEADRLPEEWVVGSE